AGGVETGTLVGNDEHGFSGGKASADADAAFLERRLLAALLGQVLVGFVIAADAQLGGQLEVAVFDGIDEGLVQGGADVHQAALVDQPHQHHLILNMSNQIRDVAEVVGQNKTKLGDGKTLQDAQRVARRAGYIEDVFDGLGQVTG